MLSLASMRRILLLLCFCGLLAVAFHRVHGASERLVHELAPGVFYWQGDEIRRVQTNVGWVIFRD